MLNRVHVVLTSLLLLAVIFLTIRDYNLGVSTIAFMDQTTTFLQTIKSDLSELREVAPESLGDTPATEPAPSAGPAPALIRVVDESDQPVPDAKLVVTWRDAKRDYFDNYDLTTDQQGERYIKLSYENDGRTESVDVSAPGFAPSSRRLTRPFGYAEPVVIRLAKAIETRIQILAAPEATADGGDEPFADESAKGGEPMAFCRVTPLSRVDAAGQSGGYSGKPLTVNTDAEGVATVNWFAEGDTVSLQVVQQDGKYHRVDNARISQPEEGPIVLYAAPITGGGFGGGDGGGGGFF